MDYAFLSGFSPKLLDVAERNAAFWERCDYRLLREHTRLHILAYVFSGEGELRIGERTQSLRPGTLFQVWPGQRMRIDSMREPPLCFHSVQYQYGLLHWDGVQAEWRKAEGALPLEEAAPGLPNPELAEAFDGLFRVWSRKEAGYEWEARVGFLETVRLAAEAGKRGSSAQEDGKAAAVREAILYMKAHSGEPLTRDDIARHAALSPAYFSSLFKRETGSSPIQFLTRLRLDRAKRLLRETDAQIRQVAETVGFADAFYFSRLFTKETGLSPRQFREA